MASLNVRLKVAGWFSSRIKEVYRETILQIRNRDSISRDRKDEGLDGGFILMNLVFWLVIY